MQPAPPLATAALRPGRVPQAVVNMLRPEDASIWSAGIRGRVVAIVGSACSAVYRDDSVVGPEEAIVAREIERGIRQAFGL